MTSSANPVSNLEISHTLPPFLPPFLPPYSHPTLPPPSFVVAESCSEWRNRGMVNNQDVQINPLYDPIWVFCNMQDLNGIGITELGWQLRREMCGVDVRFDFRSTCSGTCVSCKHIVNIELVLDYWQG